MNRVKLLSMLVGSMFVVSNTFAAGLLSPMAKPPAQHGNGILSITIIAPTPFNHWFIEKDYVGKSQSAPCSDLEMVAEATFKDELFSITFPVASEDIVDTFGESLTCIKTDFMIAETKNVYSTGNIQLIWDENTHAYTAATPNKVTMDFRKES
jgi:hypothetical protein